MDDSKDTKANFRLIMNATFAMYGKGEPDVVVVRMYFEALTRFSLDDVRKGFNLHIVDPDQGQFLPKPADIIRNIAGNSQTQAQRAWTKVDRAVRQVGPHQSVVFDDAIIHQVLSDMGGWVQLCSFDETEYKFRQNEFVKRYTGYANRPVDISQIESRMTGIADGTNRRLGFESQAPMLIGDAAKAMQLMTAGGKARTQMITAADAVKRLTGAGDD